jgi:predicted DCC family thiol-disulfide oxidoreductase YuxK
MQQPAAPTLLYNDECAVCRHVAAWVRAPARGASALVVMPIGDDPDALARLHPGLDIWDAYEVVHLLMPDAVLGVLNLLPNMHWLTRMLDLHVAGFRPGALLVDAGYTVLADVRPLLGCESCGSSNALVQSAHRTLQWLARRRSSPGRATPPAPFASSTRRNSRPLTSL